MPILLKRKNGEITPFRNAEYISAFYFIPKSILDKCGEEINSIPRNPRKLLQDRRAIEIIESDLFKLVIIDAYAFMVWPFMGLGAKREIYSGYEPSWRYAHAASIWIKGMEDEGVIPKLQEILKSSNVDEDLGYISEEEISETFTWLVPKIMAKHNMNEIIAVAAEYRCFEDFDYRKSRQKIDFYRKWYHTRAKISVESLDELKEKYAENTDGMEWDIPDDSINVESIPKRYAPLLQLEYEFKKAQRMDGIQLAFALIIELWKLITGNNIEPSSPKPLSPALRQEVRKLDQTLKEYKLLCENQIDSAQELVSFIEKKSTDISALESERQKIYNRIRHPKSEDEKEQNKTAARKISAKLKPLREDLKTAQSITERYPHILELLETERAMEIQVKTKNRERNYER